MTPFKVCGLTGPDAVEAAVGAGADWLGFVFFPKSPRHLEPAAAASLIARAPARVGKVAVLVDPDDALVDAVVAAGIDTLQLHGHETPQRLAALKARTGRPVWRALGVATRAEIAQAFDAAGAADRLLLDAKAPNGSDLPGGNGVRFDWRLLAQVSAASRSGLAWGLAGGLDADNVGAAIAGARPGFVDVSSGVEDEPGVKNASKIRAFAAAVRAAA